MTLFSAQGAAAQTPSFAGTYTNGLLSPHGTGASVIIATEPSKFSPEHTRAVEALGRSVRFDPPKAPPLAVQWQARLSGMRITYMESYYSSGVSGYGGYSNNKTYDLCANGTFVGNEDFQMNADAGGAHALSHQNPGTISGQWRVTSSGGNAVLEARFADGSTAQFQLEDRDGKTFIDGKRWYVTNDATSCR